MSTHAHPYDDNKLRPASSFYKKVAKVLQNDPMQHVSYVPSVMGVYKMKCNVLFKDNYDPNCGSARMTLAPQITPSRSERAHEV